MKISEVCAKTGLTDRAVRFYVEKGLLKKDAKNVNGRNCRDYTEQDVSILKDIALLRSVGFSIQEILEMQESSEKIAPIVAEKAVALEQERAVYQESITALKKAKFREGLHWRGLANILRAHGENAETISFHWPEENGWEGDISKKCPKELIYERKLFSKNKFCKLASSILVGMALVLCISFCFIYNRSLTTVITLSDVTFYEKWIEDGKKYATITCNPEGAIGWDVMFEEERTVQIEDAALYETIVCKNMGTDLVSYTSVNLQIEMSHGEAKRLGLLNTNQAGVENEYTFDFEKVLENEEWLVKYGTIYRVKY